MRIECKQVGKSLQGSVILHDNTFVLEAGKIYGVWGKNGCGKTMLMRAMCGLLTPLEGEIWINDKRLEKDLDIPESIGLLLERPAFLNYYTGFENLKLLASIQGLISDEEIKDTLRKVGLDPEDKRKYYKYSLGMKQRLGIACAIMEHPQIIFLDEPVNALDVEGVKQVRELLNEERERGALILVACHDKEEMQALADEILIMSEGQIVDVVEKLS